MLIKCKECGKEISDKANVCIHCGCPVEKNIQLSNDVCPLCNNKEHIENKGRDTCAICGYVFNAEEYKKENPDWNYGSNVSSNFPHCPTCGSTNLKKISTTSKAVNTVAFGIFGTKRHKTFHCNNCGYEW